VETSIDCGEGDAFKVLRKGKEVGGAFYLKPYKRGFVVSSKNRLLAGDNLFITTSQKTNEELLNVEKRKKISLKLRFAVGERAVVSCGTRSLQSDWVLEKAQSRALSLKDITDCFLKTDGLPLDVAFEEISIIGDVFMAKSMLNAFRREFFEKVKAGKTSVGDRKISSVCEFENLSKPNGNEQKIAVIADSFDGVLGADIAIYKPLDLGADLPESFKNGNFEKYVYYPAFCTQADEDSLVKRCKETKIDGVYVENYGGIEFAKANDLKIFGGAGLNFINAISVNEFLQQSGATYYAISKEANTIESKDLLGEQAFMLSSGDIKLMDLCYCPFGKTCGNCDKKSVYVLTDESGREFPVSRYVAGAGECRFEVYNCASLIGVGLKNAGQLLDLTVTQNKPKAVKTKDNEEQQKEIYAKYTSGHFKRGVL
jgi:hypothetical protein